MRKKNFGVELSFIKYIIFFFILSCNSSQSDTNLKKNEIHDFSNEIKSKYHHLSQEIALKEIINFLNENDTELVIPKNLEFINDWIYPLTLEVENVPPDEIYGTVNNKWIFEFKDEKNAYKYNFLSNGDFSSITYPVQKQEQILRPLYSRYKKDNPWINLKSVDGKKKIKRRYNKLKKYFTNQKSLIDNSLIKIDNVTYEIPKKFEIKNVNDTGTFKGTAILYGKTSLELNRKYHYGENGKLYARVKYFNYNYTIPPKGSVDCLNSSRCYAISDITLYDKKNMFRLQLTISPENQRKTAHWPKVENRISRMQLSYSETEMQKKGYDISPANIDWSKAALLDYIFKYNYPSYPISMNDYRGKNNKLRYYWVEPAFKKFEDGSGSIRITNPHPVTGNLIYESYNDNNYGVQIFYKEGYEVYRLGGNVSIDGYIFGPYFDAITVDERREFLLERERQVRLIISDEDDWFFRLIDKAYTSSHLNF